MNYHVKEIFYSLQGEGCRSGRPAVFCRLAGCNLWSGREAQREQARCRICDTDFLGTDGPGGGVYATAGELSARTRGYWPEAPGAAPYLVCTGGEPLLQLDAALVAAWHAAGFEIALETNGTLPLVPGIDWVCVSPKAGTEIVVRSGDELKLLHPQPGVDPEDYLNLDFEHFILQPMDGPEQDLHTRLALDYCLRHPRWRLGLQLQKLLRIS